jgi:hemerythrin-like domain-containing protein
MKPIGPLMVEHRLIERMISLLDMEMKRLKQGGVPDIEFLSTAVDFIRFYADRTHHGKEEDILFRDLVKKQLVTEHNRIMNELINEHVFARKTVKNLITAKDRYLQGNKESVGDIINSITDLVNLYPKHIEKEDKHFFYPVLDYFTREEQDAMLAEFREFDRKLVHEKYRVLVESLETCRK